MRQTMMYCGVLMATLLELACSKSNDVAQIDKTNDGSFKVYTEGNITTVQNLSADTILGISASGQPYGSGRFTFFSLANKSLVLSTDSASTKWDLALRGTTLLVNGGTSGPGSGGAYVFTGAFENHSIDLFSSGWANYTIRNAVKGSYTCIFYATDRAGNFNYTNIHQVPKIKSIIID